MTEVTPGIHRLQLPMPVASLEYINAYLVQGDNGYLLVDTGWNTSQAFDSLEKQLAEIGIDIQDISRIILTHIHPDHYGLVGKLKQLSQAEIILHYLEKSLIESRYVNMDALLQQMGQLLRANGVPPAEVSELQTASAEMLKFVAPIQPDITLHGGETISTGIFTFQVLWTPGHSPGHICLYEPTKKVLLSGDHILPAISPNIGLHPQSSDNPLGDYINSLNEIKRLDVNLVLPGHESPFTALTKRIEELIQHHEQRNSKILAMLKVKPKTAYQIVAEMTWLSDTNGVGWQNLPAFHRRLAISETMAHLESMRFSGKINKFFSNGTIYYQQD